MKIKIRYFGEDGRKPQRMHYNDAGADVYSPISLSIAPGETRTIGLGFGLELPDGLAGFIMVRSSMAKNGIDCKLPPIDSGYRGEIHAVIYNGSDRWFNINKGNRIGQLVILPVVLAEFTEEMEKERGETWTGSTGK